ncbi:glycosyltransferase family 2 protein [Bacillus sp. BRMEA1]|uniref:glycosyltransferase family 2 protein n=1 Tax=Neobacillus endophyticus TaxID=2738405 RepID=UPI001564121A|nr:glycosyltransferase family 2 protein [Neobacillus endophyticus]NRD76948.1 glycosyltransferase family 2 protein [Neobacillus endophyticus]
MNPLVSVILPTYNVEQYLDKCLQSISSQSYKNIEIIIVIDGATDNSYDISKKWEIHDPRVKVIYQENAGSGPARNNGLRNANGEFILFVDPDDWIESEMIEKFVGYLSNYNVDMIISGCIEETYYSDFVDRKPVAFNEKWIKSAGDVRNFYIDLSLMQAILAPTRILYSKQIIDKYNIEFPDLRRSQDIVFNYRYYDKIESLFISNDTFYHYRMDSGVYITKLKNDYYLVLLKIFSECCGLFEKWNVKMDEDKLQQFYNQYFVLLCYSIESCILRNESIAEILENEEVHRLTKLSKPVDFYHKLMKKNISLKNEDNISRLIFLKNFVRSNFRGVFNKLKRVNKY